MFIDFDPAKINHPFMVLNVYKIDDNTLKGVAVVEFKKGGTDQARRVNKNPNIITYGRNEKNDINFKGNNYQTFPSQEIMVNLSLKEIVYLLKIKDQSLEVLFYFNKHFLLICLIIQE